MAWTEFPQPLAMGFGWARSAPAVSGSASHPAGLAGSVQTQSAVCVSGKECVFKELMVRLSIRLGSNGGHLAVKTK